MPEETDATKTLTASPWRTGGDHQDALVRVRLKVEIHEIHEIQFSEVTNYRNPRNPPPISRNPHAKKRNPTPATKSTATPPKANYRNSPALDREPRFLNVVANTWL